MTAFERLAVAAAAHSHSFSSLTARAGSRKLTAFKAKGHVQPGPHQRFRVPPVPHHPHRAEGSVGHPANRSSSTRHRTRVPLLLTSLSVWCPGTVARPPFLRPFSRETERPAPVLSSIDSRPRRARHGHMDPRSTLSFEITATRRQSSDRFDTLPDRWRPPGRKRHRLRRPMGPRASKQSARCRPAGSKRASDGRSPAPQKRSPNGFHFCCHTTPRFLICPARSDSRYADHAIPKSRSTMDPGPSPLDRSAPRHKIYVPFGHQTQLSHCIAI